MPLVADQHVGRMRPRSDQRHLAAKDVEELRQLVEAGLAQDGAEPGSPADRPRLVCLAPAGSPRSQYMGAELVDVEQPVAETLAALPEQDRSVAVQTDCRGDAKQERGERDQGDCRGHHVDAGFRIRCGSRIGRLASESSFKPATSAVSCSAELKAHEIGRQHDIDRQAT